MNIAVAISGGGSKGAFSVGVLRELRRTLGIKQFRIISGTSTGSLIGTLVVNNQWTRLYKTYTSVTTDKIINPNYALLNTIAGPYGVLLASALIGGNSIFNTDALKQTIEQNSDFDAIIGKAKNGQSLLIYNTVNLQTGNHEYFRSDKHTPEFLIKALLASSNQPVLMEPVLICDHQHVDGGVREYLPISPIYNVAREDDIYIDHIFAISNSPINPKNQNKHIDNITDILGRTIDLLNAEVAYCDHTVSMLYNTILQMFDIMENEYSIPRNAINKLLPKEVVDNIKGKQYVPITTISPGKHIDMDPLEFNPKEMTKLVKYGEEICQRMLKNVTIN